METAMKTNYDVNNTICLSDIQQQTYPTGVIITAENQ